MWFFGKAKAKALAAAERKGALDLAQKMKDWHVAQDERQREIEAEFDLTLVSVFKINIWDEIEDGASFGYVEMSKVPDVVCFDVLHHLMVHLRTHGFPNVSLRYYDSTTIWTSNLLTTAGTYTSFRRWKLHLPNVDHEQLEKIVDVAKRVQRCLGKPIRITHDS